MKVIEDQCVDCGLICMGSQCKYNNVEMYYCDICGEVASFSMDGDDYCRSCAKDTLQAWFDELSIEDKCDILKVDVSCYE